MVPNSNDNKLTIQRYYGELWNQWHFDLIPQLLSPTIRFRGSLGTEVSGHAGFRAYMKTVRAAFPDFENVIDEIVSDRNKVVVRLTYHGTHSGPLFGFPATGRKVEYAGVAIFGFKGGQIDEGWVLGDLAMLGRQIGLLPPDWPNTSS